MRKGNAASDELRPEYHREDFGPMVRGKYAAHVRDASNVVVLDPEVAEAFPNSRTVNDALRELLRIARASVRLAEPSAHAQAAEGQSE